MKTVRFLGVTLIASLLALSLAGCSGSNSSSSSTTNSGATDQTEQAKKKAEQDKRDEELNEVFPYSDAAKAVVVAMTNSVLDDVFMPDGNTYDTTKFHNYSWCEQNGLGGEMYTHTAYDDDRWLIALTLDQMKNGQITNRSYTGSAYVEYDGENYIVSNPSLSFKTYKMNGSERTTELIDQGHYSLLVSEGDAPLVVSPELLK